MQYDEIDHAFHALSEAVAKLQSHRESASPELGRDTQSCLQQIDQLRLAIQEPAQRLIEMRQQAINSTALTFAVERGIIATLCRNDPSATSAKDLANEADTTEDAIERVMRMLVTVFGLAEYAGKGYYLPNDLTRRFDTPAERAAFAFSQTFASQVAARFPDFLRDPASKGFGTPDANTTPFSYALDGDIWEVLKRDQHKREVFDRFFAVGRAASIARWYDVFPIQNALDRIESPSERPLVVDIGGGKGQDLYGFVEAFHSHPNFGHSPCVLQDLPKTLDSIEPDQLHPQITKMPYDFFKGPQPVVGARFYFMHDICHDYSDADCKILLEHTVQAMQPQSRLLIQDWVIRDEDPQRQGCTTDWNMLMFLRGGKERTLSQWNYLLGGAGLAILKVWETKHDGQSVIEAAVR